MPAKSGVAMRFITSAPAPALHMMGSRPSMSVAMVMTIGRTREMAPR